MKIIFFFFLLVMSVAEADVVAPVPDDLKEVGKLVVHGEAGSEQSIQFSFRRCESAAQAAAQMDIRKSSCSRTFYAPLNEGTVVRPGHYLVWYSNSMYSQVAEVRKDETTSLQLEKIFVPDENRRTFHFYVFRDLSHLTEQQKLARFYWGTSNHMWSVDFCNRNQEWAKENVAFRDYCAAARTESLDEYRKKFFTFNQDGTYSVVRFSYDEQTLKVGRVPPQCANQGAIQVTDPDDGNFVSVFPGVYVIAYKNPETGAVATTWGLEVKAGGANKAPAMK
jgi:hypothetical protein